jgi:hypothetical protein
MSPDFILGMVLGGAVVGIAATFIWAASVLWGNLLAEIRRSKQ